MAGAVSAVNRFEAEDADFVEPGVDLFVEVGLRVLGAAGRTRGPSGRDVLSHGPSQDIALGRAVVSRLTLVGPVLCSCR